MTSENRENFNELDIKVIGKGLWVGKNNPEDFTFLIKVKNQSPFKITNVQLLITSIPQGVVVVSEKSHNFPELKSNMSKSASFKLNTSKIQNSGFFESIVTFYDPTEIMHTIAIKSFKIE